MKPSTKALSVLVLLTSNLFIESSKTAAPETVDPGESADDIEKDALHSSEFLLGLEADYLLSTPGSTITAHPNTITPVSAVQTASSALRKKRSYNQYLEYSGNIDEDGLPIVQAKTLEELAEIMFSVNPDVFRAYCNALGSKIRDPINQGSKRNLLHVAVDADDLSTAEILLTEYKFDPNEFDPYFGSAIYLVKSKAMAKLLLAAGASIYDQRICHLYTSAVESAKARGKLDLVLMVETLAVRKGKLNSALKRLYEDSDYKMKFASKRENMFKFAAGKIRSRNSGTVSPNLKVGFLDENGQDAGGLTVDFINLMKDCIINKGRILNYDEERGFYSFKADSLHPEFKSSKPTIEDISVTDELRLLGYITGLSIYHQVPLNIQFNPLINHIICGLSPHSDINMLAIYREIDLQGHNYLIKAVDMEDSMLSDYSYPENEDDAARSWKRERGELKGRADLRSFFQLKAKEEIFKPFEKSFAHFKAGLEMAIDICVISEYVRPEEVQTMIIGELDYTADEWRKACGPITLTAVLQEQYEWFWRAVDELSREQRANLLKFVTALVSLPVGGFGALEKKPIVSFLDVDDVDKLDLLPLSSTCYNQIKLYKVKSFQKMKDNLITVSKHANSGFFML